MKIKLCGLTRLEDIKAANRCMPDYIGFVFARSKRQVTLSTALTLKSQLHKDIKSVGVFVDAPISDVVGIASSPAIDVIQLHGHEDATYIEALKREVSLPIIKAVRVQSSEDIMIADKLPCDYLLLDTYVKDLAGGSGLTFDYHLIPKTNHPFFLAGGIGTTKESIKNALQTDAFCLDTSSALETNGVKDAKKMNEFCNLCRID